MESYLKYCLHFESEMLALRMFLVFSIVGIMQLSKTICSKNNTGYCKRYRQILKKNGAIFKTVTYYKTQHPNVKVALTIL